MVTTGNDNSEYRVVATDATDSPLSLKDEALEIRFYSGSEKGKWVWLRWKPVSVCNEKE